MYESIYTEDENDYMDYLDDVFNDGYGLLLREADPIAFNVGMNDWLLDNDRY